MKIGQTSQLIGNYRNICIANVIAKNLFNISHKRLK